MADSLSGWLDALDPAFFEERFGRAPFHRPAFYRGALEEIVDVRSLEYVLAATPGSPSSYVRASRIVEGGRRDERRLAAGTNLREIARLHGAGYTVCVDEINYRWPAIAAMCAGMQATLAARGQANVRGGATCGLFFAPPRSQGFALHFDRKEVFVLQIAGRKTWQVHLPVEPFPIRNSGDEELGALAGAPLLEIVLEPGDLLYVPRGFLHKPFTTGEHSLHLSFGVETITWLDVLRAMMEHAPTFRRSVPSRYFGAASAPLRGEVAAMLAELTDEGALRAALARAKFADLLAETQLAADLLHDAAAAAPIGPATRFAKRYGARCTVVRDGESVAIGFPGGSVRVAASHAPLIARILARERFGAADALPELAPGEAVELLRALHASGFLRIAGAPVAAAEPALAGHA
jgi:bifunctional lysine-specific demethylase and histidyl-hydroxylase NO66